MRIMVPCANCGENFYFDHEHRCSSLTLEDLYPITAPYLQRMRDPNQPVAIRRGAALWLILHGFDRIATHRHSTGKEIRDADRGKFLIPAVAEHSPQPKPVQSVQPNANRVTRIVLINRDGSLTIRKS